MLPQASQPLDRLPVGNLAVVQGGSDQQGRVGGAVQVVVGADAAHRLILCGLGRVAPLLVLLTGQGEGGIAHGAEHIDEGNLQHGAAKERRLLVEGCSNQGATRAATHGEQEQRG